VTALKQLQAWVDGGEPPKDPRKLVGVLLVKFDEMTETAAKACRLADEVEEELGRAKRRASAARTREKTANAEGDRRKARVDELIRKVRNLEAANERQAALIERLREHSNGQQERLAQSFTEDPPTVQQAMAESFDVVQDREARLAATAEALLAGERPPVRDMVELFRETRRDNPP
jgi:chromosome segregation ATPase